jgi:riboflavin kinase/FMN adenylyltransferase
LPKKAPLLISLEHRLRILGEMGLDYVIVLNFTERLSRMEPRDFIRKILGKMRAGEIIVGENFFFGAKKKGSAADLKKLSRTYGYKVSFLGAVKSSGRPISSTWIRDLILKGELKKASRLLSRPVTALGTVIRGTRKGRILGFPTANIDPHHEAIPPSGVYAVRVKLRKKIYDGILNIGIKPTFSGDSSARKDPTIEAHIFKFHKDIYGDDAEIRFVKRIRGEKRFKDARSLKARIAKDVKCAKRLLR